MTSWPARPSKSSEGLRTQTAERIQQIKAEFERVRDGSDPLVNLQPSVCRVEKATKRIVEIDRETHKSGGKQTIWMVSVEAKFFSLVHN